MKLVNLGCGKRFHKDWLNLDFFSTNELVQSYDLSQRLPFDDESTDVVYSSHVLEHFTKSDAPHFLSECYRILKSGGIIRIVVPDLEQLMRNYVKFFELALKGDVDAQEKYEWTMIELFDQMVRNYSGGEMLEYWKQNPMPQEKFVIQRCGSEVKSALENIRAMSLTPGKQTVQRTSRQIGAFRQGGEVHQWMYDSYSLQKMLYEIGCKDVKQCCPNESRIPGFNSYLLDIEADGSTRKPDSLFMEAVK